MPKFEIETSLPVDAQTLAADLLCMTGVNHELAPTLKMSAPHPWNSEPIWEWPVGKELFSSTVLFFGLIPIDVHHFKFHSVEKAGFQESSSSLFNKVWGHERTLVAFGPDTRVRDVVYFQSRLGVLGHLFTPIYRTIFLHRHKRLKAKYVV